ncbi:MAG: hypothetical protein WBM44_26500 [Waterburya sp.]
MNANAIDPYTFPVFVKLFQMILATLIGGIISIIGIFYLNKGLSGTSFLISGSGLRAKLVNASPGLIVCLIGALIIYFSLNSGAEIIQQPTPEGGNRIEVRVGVPAILLPLYDFLLSSAIDNQPFYETLLEVGKKAEDSNSTLVLGVFDSDGNTTLSELSNRYYRDKKYWQIIKWANSDRLPEEIDKRDIVPRDQTILIPYFLVINS